MNAWLKGYQLGPIRWQFSPEWWEKQRAKGKARFVAHGALTSSLVYVGLTAMLEGLMEGPFSISVFKLIFWMFIGIPIATSAWSENEKKYREALREAGLKALPTGKS
jgi:hypothetical protein